MLRDLGKNDGSHLRPSALLAPARPLFLSEPPWVTEIGLLRYLRKTQQLNDKPSDRLSLPFTR